MGERLPPTIISKISLPEIKKIYEERLFGDIIDGSKNKISEDGDIIHRSRKRQKVTTAALDYNDNTPSSDLISRLPDDILFSILSRLSLREIVSTSILSKRWRNLWKTISLIDLCFDVMNMTRDTRKFKKLGNDGFVRIVNQILALNCGPATMESFRLQRRLRPYEKYSQDIYKWIEFAAVKKVGKLDINLSNDFWEEVDCCDNIFPYWLFNNKERGLALRHLTLTCFPLNLPPNFSHFSSLISLTLKCLSFTQVDLTNILTSCLSLQWLSMNRCFSSSKKLKFTGGSYSSQLKHLNISDFHDLKRIDIRDLRNLMSFEFAADQLHKLLCNETAPITRVCCHAFYEQIPWFDAKKELDKKFPRLETLTLAASPLEASDVPNIPTFTNLKHLVIIMNDNTGVSSLLEPMVSFLKASPLLQTLELHLWENIFLPENGKINIGKMKNKQEKISNNSYYRHNNLKNVEIYNFHGEIEEVELVEYLVNNTVTLEKIQIDRKSLIYVGDGEWKFRFKEFTIKRKTILEMLQKIVSRSTNLIVL